MLCAVVITRRTPPCQLQPNHPCPLPVFPRCLLCVLPSPTHRITMHRISTPASTPSRTSLGPIFASASHKAAVGWIYTHNFIKFINAGCTSCWRLTCPHDDVLPRRLSPDSSNPPAHPAPSHLFARSPQTQALHVNTAPNTR